MWTWGLLSHVLGLAQSPLPVGTLVTGLGRNWAPLHVCWLAWRHTSSPGGLRSQDREKCQGTGPRGRAASFSSFPGAWALLQCRTHASPERITGFSSQNLMVTFCHSRILIAAAFLLSFLGHPKSLGSVHLSRGFSSWRLRRREWLEVWVQIPTTLAQPVTMVPASGVFPPIKVAYPFPLTAVLSSDLTFVLTWSARAPGINWDSLAGNYRNQLWLS